MFNYMKKIKILFGAALFCFAAAIITGCCESEFDDRPIYEITFDSQGGTEVNSRNAREGIDITLPSPTRIGYIFIGWYSSSDYIRYGSGESEYTVEGKLKMYAHWTQIDDAPALDLGVNGSGSDGDTKTINGIECVLVKSGMFIMGSPASEEGRLNDETQHEVTLTQDFWISKYPVTNAQYSGIDNVPVKNINWTSADEWARNKGGRLPTEAEWEFAARGGNKSEEYIYSGGNNLDEVGWYHGNWTISPPAVGRKLPNELGIYDMSGNVWEWCNDYWGQYPAQAVTNPAGSDTDRHRIIRGGDRLSNARFCRIAFRNTGYPSNGSNYLGFRVVFPRN